MANERRTWEWCQDLPNWVYHVGWFDGKDWHCICDSNRRATACDPPLSDRRLADFVCVDCMRCVVIMLNDLSGGKSRGTRGLT